MSAEAKPVVGRALAAIALEDAVVAACAHLREIAQQLDDSVGTGLAGDEARSHAARLERNLNAYGEAVAVDIARLEAQLHEPSRGPRRNDLNTRAVLDAIASAAHGWADDGTRHTYVPTQLPGRVAALYSRSLRLAKLRTEIKTLLELEA